MIREYQINPSSLKFFRLMHVFKSASKTMYKEVKDNRLLLLCFATFPTTTACATLGYISLGLTEKAREKRQNFKTSCNVPISYNLYKDFMNANFNGKYDFDYKKFGYHLYYQRRCMMMQKLYKSTKNHKGGMVKKLTQRALQRYLTKGDIAVISP